MSQLEGAEIGVAFCRDRICASSEEGPECFKQEKEDGPGREPLSQLLDRLLD